MANQKNWRGGLPSLRLLVTVELDLLANCILKTDKKMVGEKKNILQQNYLLSTCMRINAENNHSDTDPKNLNVVLTESAPRPFQSISHNVRCMLSPPGNLASRWTSDL